MNAEAKKPVYEAGQRVRASYWGEGVVVSDDPERTWINPQTNRRGKAKPLVVQRDGDGQIGHFHYDQIEEAS